ncbi:hypothetical protein OS493_024246 [Desmophyllum pertusum]|uniref:Uncharacterized protein n=1 Tax=Desmophyllum pertusum TaxID=174260 RepID=A0A9W9YY85_9CNID|nr:hypothetical protein OS493_024246 [Desmophyllum pertusum]
MIICPILMSCRLEFVFVLSMKICTLTIQLLGRTNVSPLLSFHEVHSAVEEQPLSRQDCTQENPYAHDNNGYAGAGPQSTETSDMEQSQGASGPVTVPTYAVVDKSKKKGKKDKKKDKQAAEQKPTEDQYAVVDKSKKKKKKEEPDATYAQVDMSKKSKKQKAKPGECLYADLGDFNQMREMPKVSTSPEVLPPIKKPTPYAETEYADITQFLKGDAKLPGSNNSQGQATKTDSNSPGQATLANSNSSQGHATLANSNSSQGQATLANSNSSQGQATLANSNSSQGPATDTKNTGADGKDGRANNETCL